jgi:hypothetical protein
LALVESYPSSTTTWTVTGVVWESLSGGNTAAATAYVICTL